MINSMTGFGRGTAEANGITATVELRSVNSRYLEVSARLPGTLSAYESDVQNLLKQAFERGRVGVQVQTELPPEETLPIRVDPVAARAYAQLLDSLREAAGIAEPLRLEHLLNYSAVLTTDEASSEQAELLWSAVRPALEEAIRSMARMRRQEGDALQADLEARIDAIEAGLAAVEERAPLRVSEARTRLQKRIQDLVEDSRVDPERLELEIAILADRLDVTEECVRLRSHLDLFRDALRSEAAEGRKLNFIIQEIHREINTIGSKANDASVARIAVEMKDEVEKIREQVQNVE